MLSKEEIRKELIEKRNKLSKEFVISNSNSIKEKLISINEYINCDYIYIYMDINNEVDTTEIILDAFKDNKKVAIPKVVDNIMNFYYIENINQISIGKFGIPEPISNKIANDQNALIIIPGVAFDNSKHRIGYGKGFYDKYLQNKKIVKIALAFDFQVLYSIPYDEYDISPDIIITEKQIIN